MERKVYDVFMFFNEVDLLEIRLNTLNDYVDKFIITEATTSQMGDKHELVLAKEMERFAKFKDKIIYNVVDTEKMSFPSQWDREMYQKNHTIPENLEFNDDDIIMFSDLDEIPNPLKVKEMVENFDDSVIYHFAQRMFYLYLNYEETTHMLLAACGDFDSVKENEKAWLGTKACSVKKMKERSMNDLRSPDRLKESAIRICDGGWHFSYMGGSSQSAIRRIREKLKSFSHATDYDKFRYTNLFNIYIKIRTGDDLFGRGAKFTKVALDDSYPKYIIDNKNKYSHLIL